MFKRIANKIVQQVGSFNRDKRRLSWKRESSLYFSLFSSGLQIDPLKTMTNGPVPDINLVVLVGPLDIEHCVWAIEGAIQTSRNVIKKVTIITPSFQIEFVREKVSKWILDREMTLESIDIVTDESLMQKYPLLQKTIERIQIQRRNWYKQQVLKWIAASISNRHCLIIDCELILFSPRLWLSNSGVQVHYAVNDLNPKYVVSCEKFFDTSLPKIDFVSHCALFQLDTLAELIRGDVEKFLIEWIESGYSRFHPFPISEWQTYASFMAHRFADRLVIGFQQQPLIRDTYEIHQINYFELRKLFSQYPAIYLSHKDQIHRIMN